MQALLYITVILFVFYTIFMALYKQGWKHTPVYRPEAMEGNTKVSIIIAARNEEQNISRCLKAIYAQHYPLHFFEVIVINDHSEDSTPEVLKDFPLMKVIHLAAGEEGKKKAITCGIEAAVGTLIITTDADCEMGPNWLPMIVSYYESTGAKMIAGPVTFHHDKGLTGAFQVLDLSSLIAITAAGIRNGIPQMCNGANLAYEKAAFMEIGGFTGVDHIPSGDDVFLMGKIVQQYKDGLKFLKAPEAIVYTLPQPAIGSLISQRLRWVSKATGFRDKRVTAILVIAYLFNLIILLNFIAGFFFWKLWILSAMLYVMKIVLEAPLIWSALGFFNKRHYIWWLPLVQLLHILYVVFIGVAALIMPFHWKGRSYK